MPAMIDVSCSGCGKRYGFSGKMTDCPPCPRCGKEPDRKELEETEAKLAEAEMLMLSNPTRALCGRQRVMAGLSLRQAAARLGVEPRDLADIENVRAVLPDELAKRMAELYGVGD